MKKLIAMSLSPNTQLDDVLLSLKLCLSPWKYWQKNAVRSLEQWFKQYFAVSYAIAFNSGRSGLLAILKALNLQRGDEVILQAFTCVVVVTPILHVGAKPVYVDIDHTLTIDPVDLARKITKRTKVIIVQHTFGISANMPAIMQIAKKHKIAVIEDVAHTIGAEYKHKKLGQFGKASFFSFGRDKAFSAVFGGMVITKDESLGKLIRIYQREKSLPSFTWTIQQLFYPIITYFILKTYYFCSLGKLIHFVLRNFNFFSFPVMPEEKQGVFWQLGVKKLANPLAELALQQLQKIDTYNSKRVSFALRYQALCREFKIDFSYAKQTPFLRFPIFVANREAMQQYFKQRGIYLDQWFSNVIDPKGTNFKSIGYRSGSCPQAETLAKSVINLPVFPTMTETNFQAMLKVFKQYAKNRRS